MNLLTRILGLLGLEKRPERFDTRGLYNMRKDDSSLGDRDEPQKLNAIIDKFGNDACSLLYRPLGSVLIGNEMEDFFWPEQEGRCLDKSYWHERNPLNFPGPFYAGQTDTCGTGPCEAENNILVDDNGQEFIFRQPANMQELLEVVNAGLVEVFSSYSCDGNNHWTYSLCKEWWYTRHDVTAEFRKADASKLNGRRTKLWDDYLLGEAGTDLRRYCYFLENGYYPAACDVHLPPL